jgi:hypothetical protein
MLRHSAEVRWFYEGALPDEILEWFCLGRPPAREPPRVDQYLWLPGCTTTSVKIREGKFEVKAQAGSSKGARYAEGVFGIRNHWIKWSWRLPDLERWLETQTDENAVWTSVSKTRLARVFPADAERAPTGAGGYCSFELVRLSANEQRWWSLALEVSGDPARVAEGLEYAAEQSLATAEFPRELREPDSFAYPVWLDRIIAG